MSAAKVTLVRYCRWVLPEVPVQGVNPSPVYLPIAQMRPVARRLCEKSGACVAVMTASPSS